MADTNHSDTNNRYRQNNEDVTAKVMDGEAILINLATGVYYSLDGAGARVWDLAAQGHDTRSISSAIANEYEVTTDKCTSDVDQLVKQLAEENLLVKCDAASPPEGTNNDTVADKLAYSTPSLNIYRDMGDLLALDPPIPGEETIPWDDPER